MNANSVLLVWTIAAGLALPGASQAHAYPEIGAVQRQSALSDRTAAVTKVEVFSNSAIYLTNARDARVYLLDAMEVLDSELSAGLPANEREAQKIVRQRLQAIGAAKLASRTKAGAEGIVQAARYGVDRIPAVVINGDAVIYGVTDIDVARDIFRRTLRK